MAAARSSQQRETANAKRPRNFVCLSRLVSKRKYELTCYFVQLSPISSLHSLNFWLYLSLSQTKKNSLACGRLLLEKVERLDRMTRVGKMTRNARTRHS